MLSHENHHVIHSRNPPSGSTTHLLAIDQLAPALLGWAAYQSFWVANVLRPARGNISSSKPDIVLPEHEYSCTIQRITLARRNVCRVERVVVETSPYPVAFKVSVENHSQRG